MSALDQLGQQVACEQDAFRERRSHREILRARLAWTRQRPVRSPARPRMLVALGVAVATTCAVVVLAVGMQRSAEVPLRATAGTGGPAIAAGTYLEPSGGVPLEVAFSDGTRLFVQSDARARLVTMESDGAHIALESGEVELAVTRRPHAAWQVSAGPFAVHVTGTRFRLRWDPDDQRLQLDLSEGRVNVSGCVFDTEQPLGEGQRLLASCQTGRFIVLPLGDELPEAWSPRTASTPPGSTGVVGDPAVTPIVTPDAREPAARPSHLQALAEVRRLAAAGRYPQARARARVAGVGLLCSRANAEGLQVLAEVAHYTGDASLEARALRALRRRFRASGAGRLAAFSLGRLAFDQRLDFAEAGRWFHIYLREAPRGALAREARGRRMEAHMRAGQRTEAEALAREYLRRHPAGPHSALARSLLH